MNVDCTLTRRRGGPVAAHTLEIGAGGMCVQTERPLQVDELLNFHLPVPDGDAVGIARVVRQQSVDVYALRFEGIGPEAAGRIAALSRA